jgi:hypothetical protein
MASAATPTVRVGPALALLRNAQEVEHKAAIHAKTARDQLSKAKFDLMCALSDTVWSAVECGLFGSVHLLLLRIAKCRPSFITSRIYIYQDAQGGSSIYTTKRCAPRYSNGLAIPQCRLVVHMTRGLLCTSSAYSTGFVPFTATPALLFRVPVDLAMGMGGSLVDVSDDMHDVNPRRAFDMLLRAVHRLEMQVHLVAQWLPVEMLPEMIVGVANDGTDKLTRDVLYGPAAKKKRKRPRGG